MSANLAHSSPLGRFVLLVEPLEVYPPRTIRLAGVFEAETEE